jgi:hypothetical protein
MRSIPNNGLNDLSDLPIATTNWGNNELACEQRTDKARHPSLLPQFVVVVFQANCYNELGN